MTARLPSLNALRAFEAVCRHMSYVGAANELNVTPAAVKQLVRKLEAAAGTALVERRGNGLAITPAGLAGFEGLSSGFALLARAAVSMVAHGRRRRLVVSVEPSFATAWLVPRLDRFRKANADVDVLIDSSLKLADLNKGEADLAIRFGAAPDKRLVAFRLFDERLCAFCSPSLATGEEGLRHVSDLRRATLLHWDLSELPWASATRKWMGWKPWLEMAGASHIDWQRGTMFSDYNLAVQAAVAGQGVVLGSLPVLLDLVHAGLLVNPFTEVVDTDIGYDAVSTGRALERHEVRAFASWLASETTAMANSH